MISRHALSLVPIALTLMGCLQVASTAATSAEYDRVISSAAGQIESALSHERAHPGSAGKTLDNVSGSIPSSVVVDQPDGSKIRADLSWVKSDISYAQRLNGKKRTDKLQDVLARLRTLEDASTGRRFGATMSSGRARKTLATILAGKEYQASITENVAQRMLGAISRFLARIIGPGTGDVISWVLLVGLVLGAAAILVFLVLHLINSRSPQREKVSPTTLRRAAIERPTAEALLLQAEDDARAGRFREAFRSIYLAAILCLDNRRFITYAEGTTNWEYTRAARRLAPADTARLFDDMTMRFDDLIYGQRTVTGDEYSCFRRSYYDLEAAT